MAKKRIIVPHHGPILIKGGMYGPILSPFMEEISEISRLLSSGVAVTEILSDGSEVKLTMKNFDKNNDIAATEKAAADAAAAEQKAAEEAAIKKAEEEAAAARKAQEEAAKAAAAKAAADATAATSKQTSNGKTVNQDKSSNVTADSTTSK